MTGGEVEIKLEDGSGTLNLKYLHRDPDRHGNDRLYFQRGTGPKIRMRETPGTEAFRQEYKRAWDGKPAPEKTLRDAGKDSLSWLVQRYVTLCGEFKGLKQRTRHVRRQILDHVCVEPISEDDPTPIGSLPYREITAPAIRTIRDRKADTPEAANASLKALRQVFKWAVADEKMDTNPADRVPYLESTGDGFHTWEVEEVEQFEARHPPGSKARRALYILLYSGARRSDAVRFGKQMIRNGWLKYTAVKSRKKKRVIEVPILPLLQVELDRGPQDQLTFLMTEFGKPFTSNGFGNWFRRRCDEAGLKQCSAHGLRKAGATIAANRGATPHQLMSIYGWETIKEAQLYTEHADRRRLAGEAMHLLVPESSHRDSGEKIGPVLPNKNKG